ncbi:MAG: hypothetical protein Q9201_002971 [Fulgogasparrea decipioides]
MSDGGVESGSDSLDSVYQRYSGEETDDSSWAPASSRSGNTTDSNDTLTPASLGQSHPSTMQSASEDTAHESNIDNAKSPSPESATTSIISPTRVDESNSKRHTGLRKYARSGQSIAATEGRSADTINHPGDRQGHSPSETSDAPSEISDAPSATLDAPPEAHDAPSKTSDAPSETPDGPSEISEAPSKIPDAPSKTPDAPSKTSDAPSKTPDAPSKTPDAPSATLDAPPEAHDAPAATKNLMLIVAIGLLILTGLSLVLAAFFPRFVAIQYAPRNSSRVEIGDGLDKTYLSLSQTMASCNSLFKTPGSVSQQRRQANNFGLSASSAMHEPLSRFLDQSVDIDEDVLRLILTTGQMATSALRQQEETDEVLRSIQYIRYWGIIEPLKIRFLGVSNQEKLLHQRLEHQIQLLSNETSELEQQTHEVLQRFLTLTSTTADIRKAAINDDQRFTTEKSFTASGMGLFSRAALIVLQLPEPVDLATLSKNVKLAQDIHQWSQDVVDGLQRAQTYLKAAKVHIAELMGKFKKRDMIKWSAENKEHELTEFLAQITEGLTLLETNTAAWGQLQRPGVYSQLGRG